MSSRPRVPETPSFVRERKITRRVRRGTGPQAASGASGGGEDPPQGPRQPRPGAPGERVVVLWAGAPELGVQVARAIAADHVRVLAASTIEAALTCLSRDPLHLVVADSQLAGGEGCAILARARALQPSALRALVTEAAEPGLLREAINAGGCHRLILRSRAGQLREEHLAELVTEALARTRRPAGRSPLVLVVARDPAPVSDPRLSAALGAAGVRLAIARELEQARAVLGEQGADLVVCADDGSGESLSLLSALGDATGGASRALAASLLASDQLVEAVNRLGVERVLETPLSADEILAALRARDERTEDHALSR